ncbi:hypothetical protein C9374_001328 [Naegleria lovaniensis]|uniref:MYND-type domain-containing protein n=1 Tax=Naegleria lovaniensis TaxID=51637 RepID=A0AA88GX63_NAELO|nr:uncharacterized protein C9374_001328 [Naegleria lovaniensis]KAG2387734.1 hypothetical protein C9374_001328 [Naegleria lovaniensis]
MPKKVDKEEIASFEKFLSSFKSNEERFAVIQQLLANQVLPMIATMKRKREESNKHFSKKEFDIAISILTECIDEYLTASDENDNRMRLKEWDQTKILSYKMQQLNVTKPVSDRLQIRKKYKEIEEQLSNAHLIFSNRSVNYLMSGKYLEAKQDALDCIEWNSDWPKGYYRAAQAAMMLGEYTEALETISKGVEVVEQFKYELFDTDNEYDNEIKRFSTLKKEVKEKMKNSPKKDEPVDVKSYFTSKYKDMGIGFKPDFVFTCITVDKPDDLEDYLGKITDSVEKKGLVDQKDPKFHFTPLHLAVCFKRKKCLEILLNHGANANVVDLTDLTPISYAVGQIASLSITKLLLSKGGNVNFKNKSKVTYLHTAAAANNLKICQYLIEKHGLDPKSQTIHGDDCISVASDNNVIEYLRKKQIRADKKEEQTLSTYCCKYCGKSDALKRCSICKSVFYCSIECQKKDWTNHKATCLPVLQSVRVEPSPIDSEKPLYGFNVSNVVGSQDGIKLKSMTFQVLSLQNNHDRSYIGYIRSSEPRYEQLNQKITSEGIMGRKGYFYVTINTDSSIDIEVGKLAPSQSW